MTLLALAGASAAGGQLLPGNPVGEVLGGVGRVGSAVIDDTLATTDRVGRSVPQLARARLERLGALVRAHRDVLEMTEAGPAVRGEIIAVDPDPATLAAAGEAGFAIIGEEVIEGLGIRSVTLRPPAGLSLDKALARLKRLAPQGDFTANHIHLASGAAVGPGLATAMLAQSGAVPTKGAVGIIDGGAARHPALAGPIEQRGFASGAPAASVHGTAVASLLAGSGPIRGVAPGAPLLVADVYGRDPRGGNALAIARALGFMSERRVPVVTMSLVGPPNALLAKAVARAQGRGVHIVAAVGNDGPAAPPAYPASYQGVIAVTGVDRRNRALIEAGRALHLDYAAPGADMAAASADGGSRAVRGTSYAVPLVAGRLHRLLASGAPARALDAEAVDLGPKGPDRLYGRGLVCGDCRTPIGKK